MFTSEAITRGVRVAVKSEYAPDRSRPGQQQWFFLYTITITNEGRETVQLISRHWIITDGGGRIEEVRPRRRRRSSPRSSRARRSPTPRAARCRRRSA